jgi:hypothetical protein
MPLHLEEHLDAAIIEGSKLPTEVPEPIRWSFDEPQLDWRAFSLAESRNPMQATRTDDALRVILTHADTSAFVEDLLAGGIYTDFPGLLPLGPAYLMIRARTESAAEMVVVFDDLEGDDPRWLAGLFRRVSEESPMIADGSVQSYLLPLNTGRASGGACCRFGVGVGTHEPGSVDILSVRVVSKAAAFAGDPLGVMTVVDWSKENRRVLFTHTPGRVAFTVRVPRGGRLDVGLGVLQDDAPVDFRVTVTSRGQQEEASLLEETVADKAAWVQRSVDLSDFDGQTVTLALQADAEMAGTVAMWAAPGSGVHSLDALLGEESSTGYRNPRAVELIDQLEQTLDPDVIDLIYTELSDIIRADVPMTYLTMNVETYVAHRRIKGLSTPFRANPVWNAEHLWIEEPE